MGQTVGPVDLTVGQVVSETVPAGLLNPAAVVAINRSPFVLAVTSPTTKTLPAWTADLLAPPANPGAPGASPPVVNSFTAIPSLTPGAPSSNSSTSLYLDWLGPGEVAQGLYPLALAADALNIAGGSVTISGKTTVTIAGGSVSISGTPTVSISGTPTINVSSGTITVDNAAGSAGVNTAPKTSDFTYQALGSGSAVLLGGTTQPAFIVHTAVFSNGSAATTVFVLHNSATGGEIRAQLGAGQSLSVPLDFLLEAGMELIAECSPSSSACIIGCEFSQL